MQSRRLISFRYLIPKVALIYVASVSLMILSVVAVNLIPNDPILRHLRQSLPTENYTVLFGSTPTDQFAECAEATVGISPKHSELGLLERSIRSPTLGSCEQAWQFLKTGTSNAADNQWFYWNGAQIIMRPALAIASVLNVRALTFFLFVSSFMFAFLSLYRYGLNLAGLGLFAGLFCVHLQSALFLLPHAMDWVIGFVACGWIVTALKGNAPISANRFSCAFFLIGSLDAFFSQFCYPLLSLTIPLFGVFWAVGFQKEKRMADSLVLVLAATCFWSIGYAAIWSTKWLLATFFIDDVFANVLGAAKFRLNGASGEIEMTLAKSFISVLRETQATAIFAVVCFIASLVPLVRFVKTLDRRWSDLSSFAIICALPLLWFAGLRNLAIIHAWFVSAGLYISFAMIFSLLLISWNTQLISWDRSRART
jgi:hypothetical protein